MRREMRLYPMSHCCLKTFAVLAAANTGHALVYGVDMDPSKNPSGTRFVLVPVALADAPVTGSQVLDDEDLIDEFLVFTNLPSRFYQPRLYRAVEEFITPMMTDADKTVQAVTAGCLGGPQLTGSLLPSEAS